MPVRTIHRRSDLPLNPRRRFNVLLILVLLLLSNSLLSQSFLKTSGKNIVDGNGNNIILKGIGTGNWMLQEGYMMKTGDVAGTQHEFRQKLIETIGLERTEEFYESWLRNHMTRADVDSMASWGFNSVRLAMHYNLYTLPVEDEPIEDQHTWLEKGFALTDSLLGWCEENHMYLILDLHGAPGGQGKNASISDYDPSKPALWESEANKEKTIALWQKLAERYRDEPWIGGYDLINEVNWTFSGSNNAPLRDLYGRITEAIRSVDQNHIIFIEGNDFANNFNGLTPPWDNNMVYSFHKYWTYNDENSLNWVINLRDTYNIPLWLGETGENSNTWFTNLASLCERENIGWSWWPVKKSGINNVLEVETNEAYDRLIETWRGNGSMTADAAFEAVMKWSDNHRLENCRIKHDVVDALMRQPQTNETRPFIQRTESEKIFATDFDLGRNNFAYYDTDSMNCHFSNSNDTIWNIGWSYRNDGVDIESCNDSDHGNGYSIGWTKKGEWLQYTLNNSQAGAYRIKLRTASLETGKIHVEINGKVASSSTEIIESGSWWTWTDNYIDDVIIPEGEVKLKIVFDSDGINLNYLELTDPKNQDLIPFRILSALTDKIDNRIYINLNRPVNPNSEIDISDFNLIVDHSLAPIKEIKVSESNQNKLILETDTDLFYTDKIKLSYTGYGILSGEQKLERVSAFEISNLYHHHFELPVRIEAEDYFLNNGFQLLKCLDVDGGENTGYADDGDYLDYLINVPKPGKYLLEFRVASLYEEAEILVMHTMGDKILPAKAVKFSGTGGWQEWETQRTSVILPEGKLVFRIYSRSGQHNLNWFSFSDATGIESSSLLGEIKVFPNPASDSLNLVLPVGEKTVKMINMEGKQVMEFSTPRQHKTINTSSLPNGVYILQVSGSGLKESHKIQIIR